MFKLQSFPKHGYLGNNFRGKHLSAAGTDADEPILVVGVQIDLFLQRKLDVCNSDTPTVDSGCGVFGFALIDANFFHGLLVLTA